MNRLILILIFISSYSFAYCQSSQICGNIGDPTGQCPGFAGVNVVITNVNGDILCQTTTTAGGNYCCTIDNSEFPIIICPNVDCPMDDQINIFDLVLIQNFILGLPNPNSPNGTWSPYFHYWADVNGDGTVSAADLALLRKYVYGILIPQSICRIISEKCKLESNQYNYWLCLGGCEYVADPFSANGNFEIFHIGDVNNSIIDGDCTKPLQNGGEEEYFKIPNSQSLVNKLNPSNNMSIGFEFYQKIRFLNLSIEIGNLGYGDFIFPIKDADYTIIDGKLHISYFSQKRNHFIDVKDILIVKDPVADFQYLVSNSAFVNNRNEMFGIDGTIRNSTKANTTIIDNFGNLIINFSDNIGIENNSVLSIYNTEGRLILHTKINSTNIEKHIEIDNLNQPNGMYILNILNSKGSIISSKKFLISN